MAATGALVQRCATAACGTPHHGAGEAGGGCACAACSATAATAKVERDDALSHLLARAVAQRAAAAAPPHYKDSETEAPGVRDPDTEVLCDPTREKKGK